ncbi:MAG TPA: hypothetical protein VFB74_33980 [Kribbellaceae bacterium]|nr:hypothetical protein [Kribbellaceae bacterium]
MEIDVRSTVLVTITMELHELSTVRDLVNLGMQAGGHNPTDQAGRVSGSIERAYLRATDMEGR